MAITVSQIRNLLFERNIQLTKSLGQSFLHDANQLRRIVDAANLTKTDRVLEIGPGLGPLTELLLEKADEVVAIEKDERLVEVLMERFHVAQASHVATKSDEGGRLSPSSEKSETGAPPVLHLIHADALEFIRQEKRDWTDWKMVSNLPYSLASTILVELALMPGRPQCMVVTLQLEVVKRLTAKPDGDDYGLLTLLVQLDYEPRQSFKIPRRCFFPEPAVDSACIVLLRRSKPIIADEHRSAFVKIVKRALSQRRKMMIKLLKSDWPLERLTQVFAELKISPQERAEKLSLQQFVQLTGKLVAVTP
jgi:16S rRNA (adenine1518-N6/adenine1519-N6)-dimethyltransferase